MLYTCNDLEYIKCHVIGIKINSMQIGIEICLFLGKQYLNAFRSFLFSLFSHFDHKSIFYLKYGVNQKNLFYEKIFWLFIPQCVLIRSIIVKLSGLHLLCVEHEVKVHILALELALFHLH